MKTTFLLAAVTLIATTGFAQTTTGTSANTSAQASVQTDARISSAHNQEQGDKKTVKPTGTEKKPSDQQPKKAQEPSRSAAEIAGELSGSSSTETRSGHTATGNNSGKETSLNSRSSLSETSNVTANTAKISEEGKDAAAVTTKTAVNTGQKIQSSSQTIESKVVTKAVAARQTIKPRAAAVRVNTHIANASAIRIR